jgi:hypothetical protein
MKQDILEQLVDGWFLRQPATFTKHNVKYKPQMADISNLSRRDKSRYTVSSDIDLLAIHLDKVKENKVSVVSCKSWQSGFDIDFFFDHLSDIEKQKVRVGTSDAWKKFRELVEPMWAKAFRDAIYRETKSHDFTYYIAITKIRKNKDKKIENFRRCDLFLNNLSDNGKHKVKIDFLPLEKIINQIFGEEQNTTLEATEIGRFTQLMRAAGIGLSKTAL